MIRYLIIALLGLLPLAIHAAEPAVLRIAVAANFKPTLTAISADFETETGIELRISSASTGVLANQLAHGAPYDLFFAADQASPRWLHERDPERFGEPFCYARGELVLAGSDRLSALADPAFSLAIANPRTAPYGKAAAAVLARSDFAAGQGRKLVRGNNALQAFQFWHTGAVQMALLPRALAPKGIAVPADWHPSLDQHALVAKPSAAASAYLAWLKSDTVRALISQAGYEPCP